MFSGLGKVFLNKPHQAENTDIRKEIRRHDPEYERRKQKKKDPEEEIFDGYDNATVSVEALSVFLKNFLKSLEEKEGATPSAAKTAAAPDISEQVQATKAAEVPSPQVSGQAAKAMNAYQTTAQSSRRTSSILDSTDENAQNLGLESSEIRTIYTLLDDLKILSDQKVEFLRIERSESFLQSLQNAVARAKK